MLLALILVGVLVYHAGLGQLITRVTKVGIGPFSVEAVEQKLSSLRLDPEAPTTKRLTSDQVAHLTKRFNEAAGGNPKVNILWVDDNPLNNREVVDLLETMGFHIYVSRSYADGIARFEERPFSVVISDYSEDKDPAQIAAMSSGKSYPGVGPLIAEYVGKRCGPRTIIFTSGWSDSVSTPPYVFRETNNFYDLLDAAADLIGKPIAPECR
ncbi:MAG TPA: hypothetical protein VNX29_05350 [Kaistia sp.]|nr:hypothetical protein [Kaistia sp.]